MAVIEVIPEEIRYWLSTSNAVTKAADIVASATTGKVSAPGELRTISKQEVCRIVSVAGAGWAEGVTGSPWKNVDVPYTPIGYDGRQSMLMSPTSTD